MVRFGVGLIAIVLIFVSFERQLMSSSASKQVESWISTGLKTQDIANFYQNFNCKSTQKVFLACVNSLQSMANYLERELKWSESNGLGIVKRKVVVNQNEKMRLAPWVKLFKSNKHLSMNFENAWKQIESEIQSHRFSSYIVGMGINGYLSIHRDPHSYLLPREYYEKVVANSNPRVNSYGFNLGKSETEFVFARIYPGSLFDNLGVSKGDVILEIDGKDISHLDLETVSEWLKTKDMHQFKVKLANNKIMTWKLDKKNQVLPAVSMKRLPREKNKSLHLISIFKISEGVCESVKSNLRQAIKEKTNGVILDLRDNSGGSMDEILCISGLFVGDKKIYDLVYFNKRFRKETFFSDQAEVYFGPLVVLVNRSTASSAEILAGVIQHYERGLLIGERTFGKGSFQEGEEWPKNKRLLYFQTKGTFHLPSGRSPQLLGITPDIQVKENFASIFQREEELYLYPVGNREVREKVSKRVASVQECGSAKKEILTADRLLGKALGHIDCIQF
ncbi:MAG: PDZ domain-containing protein [Bdellovibrionaceae bacterium]|nr:PDZ domain-containing protein [Pseudobdellovibrionaceae bacterium]